MLCTAPGKVTVTDDPASVAVATRSQTVVVNAVLVAEAALAVPT